MDGRRPGWSPRRLADEPEIGARSSQIRASSERLPVLDDTTNNLVPTAWPGETTLEIELTDELLEGVSLTGARAIDAPRSCAGRRIVGADPRYPQVDVERVRSRYRLRAVRREPAPPNRSGEQLPAG